MRLLCDCYHQLSYYRPKQTHVWVGISWQGATVTDRVIFDGIMDASGYIEVLKAGLLPFIRNKLTTHKLMQDNDPESGLWTRDYNSCILNC